MPPCSRVARFALVFSGAQILLLRIYPAALLRLRLLGCYRSHILKPSAGEAGRAHNARQEERRRCSPQTGWHWTHFHPPCWSDWQRLLFQIRLSSWVTYPAQKLRPSPAYLAVHIWCSPALPLLEPLQALSAALNHRGAPHAAGQAAVLQTPSLGLSAAGLCKQGPDPAAGWERQMLSRGRERQMLSRSRARRGAGTPRARAAHPAERRLPALPRQAPWGRE